MNREVTELSERVLAAVYDKSVTEYREMKSGFPAMQNEFARVNHAIREWIMTKRAAKETVDQFLAELSSK